LSINPKSLYVGRNIELHSNSFGCKLSPFDDHRNLTLVVFGPKVTKVTEHLFAGCREIRAIVLPNSVRIIEPLAFTSCGNLEELSLGERVDSIGEYAFQHDNLKVINCQSKVPPIYDTRDENSEPFDKNTYMTAKLRIPRGSLDAYKSADGWKKFWNIEEVDTFDIQTPNILEDGNGKAKKKKKRGIVKNLLNTLNEITTN